MKFIIILLLTFFTFLASVASAEILTVYSDKGIPPGTMVGPWTDGGDFDGDFSGISPVPEGYKCFKTTCTGTFAGWGVFYGNWGDNPQNLTDYNGGDLRFWIYSSTGSVKVDVETTTTTYSERITDHDWTDANINSWKHIVIPLSEYTAQGATFDQVKSPFKITADGLTSPATFYADLVRWTTGFALPDMQIKIKRISDNIEVSSITWSPVTLSTGWVTADCYIELEADVDTMAWGIQIYTDNLAGDADPAYTGTATSRAGLIDTANTTSKLPMGWMIHQDTYTYSVTAADPDVNASWFYFKDPGNTEGDAMTNGEDYVTAKDERGIHYAQGDWWAGDPSPDYIYLEANFGGAVVGRTYKTKTLRIELYYE